MKKYNKHTKEELLQLLESKDIELSNLKRKSNFTFNDKIILNLFNNSPESILLIDNHGLITDCNQKATLLYDADKKDLVGKQLDIFYGNRNVSQSILERIPSTGILVDTTIIITLKNNQKNVQQQLIRISDNKVSFILFEKDISDAIKNEELLQLQSSTLEAAANSIAITNKRGDVVWVNNAFTKLTGYSKDEMIYKNISILRSGMHDIDFYNRLWDEIHDGGVWSGEVTNMRKDGSVYIEHQTITPVFNNENEIIYFISVREDITKKIASEKEAKEHKEQLIQADKMVALGTLVSGIAHEINNPTNFIMLNTPLLKKTWDSVIPILEEHYEKHGDFKINGKLSYSKVKNSFPEMLNAIDEGSKRIKNIVGELKDFARQKSSELKEDINVNEVIKAAVSLTNNLAHKHTNNFLITYGQNIPPIYANFQRLEQVVINLVENSCQALTDTNQSIFLNSYADNKNKNIIIEVIDEGKGMDKTTLKKIMDPFFTTKRHSGGTGLGLSVSSKIILNHNGTLDFDSSPGNGTKARIILPMKEKFNE